VLAVKGEGAGAGEVDSWAQLAVLLASGKWPAPQMLSLIVWSIALLALAM
jgi:hypothetical protein